MKNTRGALTTVYNIGYYHYPYSTHNLNEAFSIVPARMHKITVTNIYTRLSVCTSGIFLGFLKGNTPLFSPLLLSNSPFVLINLHCVDSFLC